MSECEDRGAVETGIDDILLRRRVPRRAFLGAAGAAAAAVALAPWGPALAGAGLGAARRRMAGFRGRLLAGRDLVVGLAEGGELLCAGDPGVCAAASGWGPVSSPVLTWVDDGAGPSRSHVAAVLRDGTVRCTYGEWAAAVSGWSGVASLFCDGFLSAVDADGGPLLQDPATFYDTPYDLSSWPACTKVVDGGRGFVAGLTGDGGVVAAATDVYDKEGFAASLGAFSGEGGPRAVDIACGCDLGSTWLLVLCADGTLWYNPFNGKFGFNGPFLVADGVVAEPGAGLGRASADEAAWEFGWQWGIPSDASAHAYWALLEDGRVFRARIMSRSGALDLGSAEPGGAIACRGAASFDGVLSDGSWAAVRADGSVWWSGSRLWSWDGAVAAAAGAGFCAALFADGTVRTTPGGPDTSGWRLW